MRYSLLTRQHPLARLILSSSQLKRRLGSSNSVVIIPFAFERLIAARSQTHKNTRSNNSTSHSRFLTLVHDRTIPTLGSIRFLSSSNHSDDQQQHGNNEDTVLTAADVDPFDYSPALDHAVDEAVDRLPFEDEPNDFDDDDEDDIARIEIDDQLDDDDDESTATPPPPAAAAHLFNVTKTSPLSALNSYYKNEYGVSSVSEQFTTKQILLQWHATFVCPVTQIQYTQGSLRDDEEGAAVEMVVSSSAAADGTCYYNYNYAGNRHPGYRKKKTAIQAAAARVLDSIQYQTLNIREPRLCLEDPAIFSMHNEQQAGGSGMVEEATSIILDDDDDDDVKQQELAILNELPDDHDVFCSTIPLDQDSSSAALLSQHVFDPNDYLVANVPSPCSEHEPSQRLLEAFLSLQHDSSSQPAASMDEDHRMPNPLPPMQQILLAVDVAVAWAEANSQPTDEIKSHPHRLFLPSDPSTKTLVIGKTLLNSLAEMYQSTTAASSSQPLGCEKAAWQILDVLWEHETTQPDADAYNAHLRCLEGNDVKRVAERAQLIVSAMQSGEKYNGRVLPKPNIETMNTLIQLWAQIGGTSGRHNMVGFDFVPNRNSFLSILSSCCYPSRIQGETGGLDLEFATECIRRMRELSKANPEETSLVPDTQVYNAPLRWAGGSNARKSRPYARRTQWDIFSTFYMGDGYKTYDKDDSRILEAQAMEKWIDIMKENGVPPDIETYEALMQCWLRTCTRVGLDRAHSIANELLDGIHDGVLPRLLTFRPLTTCWLFSLDPEAADKIELLIGRMEALSSSIPQLLPDNRLYAALLGAYKNEGIRQVQKGSVSSVEALVDVGNKCNSILRNLHERFRSSISNGEPPDVFFDVVHFVDAAGMWQTVAEACLMKKTEDKTETLAHSLKEMVGVIDFYDDLIQQLMREESTDGIGLRLKREYSFQLKHLLSRSGALYSSCIIGIKKLSMLQKQKINRDETETETKLLLLNEYLPLMERMVRRSGETEIAASHDSSLKAERQGITEESETSDPQRPVHIQSDHVEYDDFFVAGRRIRNLNNVAAMRHVLLGQMIECLQYVDVNQINKGDYARLLLLIKESAKDGRIARTISNGETVDSLLDRLVWGNRDVRHPHSFKQHKKKSPSHHQLINQGKEKGRKKRAKLMPSSHVTPSTLPRRSSKL